MNEKSESLLSAILQEVILLNQNVTNLTTRVTKVEDDITSVRKDVSEIADAFPNKDIHAHRTWHDSNVGGWLRRMLR